MFNETSTFFALGILLEGTEVIKSLIVTILLVIGGIRLRRLRASGATLIQTALWVGLIGGCLLGGFIIMVGVVAASEEADPFPDANSVQDLVNIGLMLIGLCESVFMVVALIWLTRRKATLPLTMGT